MNDSCLVSVKITYKLIISEPLQRMPCQDSPHGSPAAAIQPGRTGEPSAANRPFTAATVSKKLQQCWLVLKQYIQISLGDIIIQVY